MNMFNTRFYAILTDPLWHDGQAKLRELRLARMNRKRRGRRAEGEAQTQSNDHQNFPKLTKEIIL